MSYKPRPEETDEAAEVLSLQETPASETDEDVQAHISTISVAFCDIHAN